MARYLIKGTFIMLFEGQDIEDAHEEVLEIHYLNRSALEEFHYEIEELE
tara:strand:+ start:214 stop:360 length:147 start_codon:yes stop_codon:yes gene_type:complete